MFRFFVLTSIFLLLSCSKAYNLTDRSGNTFVIEGPELDTNRDMEYRAGDAITKLAVTDIVSLSIPNADPQIFDGRVFYPATLKLEDTVAVPANGFICVEGNINAENAGGKFSIPLANVKELNRKEGD
ncbi:MAG: hypothetical protein FWB90_07830 [Fibromonadales bacterium]|nr:hypothetical protein [Fibromonadales bacterium]